MSRPMTTFIDLGLAIAVLFGMVAQSGAAVLLGLWHFSTRLVRMTIVGAACTGSRPPLHHVVKGG